MTKIKFWLSLRIAGKNQTIEQNVGATVQTRAPKGHPNRIIEKENSKSDIGKKKKNEEGHGIYGPRRLKTRFLYEVHRRRPKGSDKKVKPSTPTPS